MTINLLLNSEGKKMGKTQSGAVWLDPNKTSPFEFYQYWRNVSDADVLKCLRMLTFLPLEEINAMESWEGSQLNEAKNILAYELTKLVHGEEEANKARELLWHCFPPDPRPTCLLRRLPRRTSGWKDRYSAASGGRRTDGFPFRGAPGGRAGRRDGKWREGYRHPHSLRGGGL